MKRIALVLSVLALCALGANALTLYDDFESYPNVDVDPADTVYENGINMKGETVDRGAPIEKWNSQVNNGNRLGNDQWSRVEEFQGNNYLIITNRDQRSDALSTCTTTCTFGDDGFFGAAGTLYVQYIADTVNDVIVGTNGFEPGYFTDVVGQPADPDNLYQGVGAAPYARQGQIVRFGADQPFYARNGGAYETVATVQLPAEKWIELWIDLDCANLRSRYYVAIDGAARQRVDNAGGEWWGWRNLVNDFAFNMMINQGATIAGQQYETVVIVDNIAINPTAFDNGSLPLGPNPYEELPPPLPGDANLDDVVNINDFIILKQNYGLATGATWGQGDFNADGAVNINDFIILKQNYGTSR